MRRYEIASTKRYKKDYKRIQKSQYDLEKLDAVIDTLASGEVLTSTYHDHELKGSMARTRECHIAPDWILQYAKDDEKLILILIRTGSHRMVLGIE